MVSDKHISAPHMEFQNLSSHLSASRSAQVPSLDVRSWHRSMRRERRIRRWPEGPGCARHSEGTGKRRRARNRRRCDPWPSMRPQRSTVPCWYGTNGLHVGSVPCNGLKQNPFIDIVYVLSMSLVWICIHIWSVLFYGIPIQFNAIQFNSNSHLFPYFLEEKKKIEQCKCGNLL